MPLPTPRFPQNHSLKEILPFSIIFCVQMSVKDILICQDQNIYIWHRLVVLGRYEVFLLTQKNVQKFYIFLTTHLNITV